MMVFLNSCRKDDFSEALPAKLSMVKVAENWSRQGPPWANGSIENLQETRDFPMKYGGVMQNCPF